MKKQGRLTPAIQQSIAGREPFLWLNDRWLPMSEAHTAGVIGRAEIQEAAERLARFSGMLAELFPELRASGGIVESALHRADALKKALMGERPEAGRWFIKCDHA